jgi:aspartyl protease family protein
MNASPENPRAILRHAIARVHRQQRPGHRPALEEGGKIAGPSVRVVRTMPTGFIDRYSSALALARRGDAGVRARRQLIGTFGDQAAVLSIDGGEPKTVRAGQKFGGGERDLRRQGPRHGGRSKASGARCCAASTTRRKSASDDRQSAVLAADGRGHFHADGAINGGSMRFILDTGATSIALPAADAVRLGLDYRKGRPATIHTANGPRLRGASSSTACASAESSCRTWTRSCSSRDWTSRCSA